MIKLYDLLKEKKIKFNTLEKKECLQLIEEIKKEKLDRKFIRKTLISPTSYPPYSDGYYIEFAYMHNLIELYKFLKIKIPFEFVSKIKKEFQIDFIDNVNYTNIDTTYCGHISDITQEIIEKANFSKEQWFNISNSFNIKKDFIEKNIDKLDLDIIENRINSEYINQEKREILEIIGKKEFPKLITYLLKLIKKQKKELDDGTGYGYINEQIALEHFKKNDAVVYVYEANTYYGSGLTIDDYEESSDKLDIKGLRCYEYQGRYLLTQKDSDTHRGNFIISLPKKENEFMINQLFSEIEII